MREAAVSRPLDHPVLMGVETLPVGSAKVPRLPCLTELVEAPDVPSAAAALLANAPLLETYSAALEADGLDSMAATLRRVLARAARIEHMNSDLASVITWVLNAQHKTAGRATMQFAPWAVGSDSAPVRLENNGAGTLEVAVSAQVHDLMTEANVWIYERIIGLLNAAACGGGTPPQVLDRLLQHESSGGTDFAPRFVEPGDVKSLLKIDYKLDADGRLVIVDVNAGLIGAWFDDLLLDEAPDLTTDAVRITPRLAAAVLERFRLERGRDPRRIALCVLDGQMYEQWADADIAGLKDEFVRQVSEAGAGPAEFVVVDASGLEGLARGEVPHLLAGEWSGPPDLVVFYSCRIAPHAEPAVLTALEDAGVTLVDGAVHGMAAGKELATPEVLGHGLPDGVRLPQTFVLGAADGGADAVAAVREAWQMALERGWSLLAVKIDKQRRAQGAGDFPSAYLYPVTAVGRQLVERQIERTFERVTTAAGRASRLVVTHVDHLGGCDGALGHRDVELRTYAFPIIPQRGSA